MPIEVEQKYRLADRAAFETRLAALRPSPGESEEQVDCYFAHPARDFARTDEALRLRRSGDLNYITYKGPKLDATTKTRREIEIPLAAGEVPAGHGTELLEALGFRLVAEVAKRRSHCSIRWKDQEVEVSLDDVAGLGDFVELEIVCEPAEVEAARQALASLSERLQLSNCERRSYLELLLESRQSGG
jgi:adenylate cyclase class 2